MQMHVVSQVSNFYSTKWSSSGNKVLKKVKIISFKSTAKIVEKKWKNLSDQFRTKEKSGTKGPTEAAKAQEWRFYNEMSFLKPYIKNNK